MARSFRGLLLSACAGLFLCGVAFAAPLTIHIVEAQAKIDPVTGEPVLGFTMTPESGKAFAELTAANIGKTVELRIDGKTITAPIVREPITNGLGQISGDMTMADANDLAKRLMAGTSVIEVEAVAE